MEPRSKRSPEAFAYIKAILNYGVKWTDEKSVTISVSPEDREGPDFLIPMTVAAATSDKKGLTKTDSLALQLKEIFAISDEIGEKKERTFYKNYFAAYFKNLAASGNTPAFSRYISLSVYKDENLQWFKEHEKEADEFSKWAATTERKFE